MNCPRCSSRLQIHPLAARWRTYFECPECWLCFRAVQGQFRPGREPRAAFTTSTIRAIERVKVWLTQPCDLETAKVYRECIAHLQGQT